MNRIATELLVLARELLGIEFDTKKQMDDYKREHDVRRDTKLMVKPEAKKPVKENGKVSDKVVKKLDKLKGGHQEIHDRLSQSSLSKERDFSHGECSVFATNLYSVLSDMKHSPKIGVWVKDGEPLHITVVDGGYHIDHKGVSSEEEMGKRLKTKGSGKVEEFDTPEDADKFVESLREKGAIHEMEFRVYSDLEKEIAGVLRGKSKKSYIATDLLILASEILPRVKATFIRTPKTEEKDLTVLSIEIQRFVCTLRKNEDIECFVTRKDTDDVMEITVGFTDHEQMQGIVKGMKEMLEKLGKRTGIQVKVEVLDKN